MNLYTRSFLLTLILTLSVIFTTEAQSLTRVMNYYEIERRPSDIKIDGRMDEAIWSVIKPVTNFTQLAPNPGSPSALKTEVYITYDDYAIYIAARMTDDHPDKIFAQLSERDGDHNADRFSFIIDPYNSGTNGFAFTVTAANIQLDARMYDGGDDSSWDGVWLSKTTLNSTGWVAEMKIPFSAIRLPDAGEQTWAVNFIRECRRLRETSSWNPINPNVEGILNQCGSINGICDIKTPLRLSVSPYASVTTSKSAIEGSKFRSSFNGGMDLKLGLSDAFTLDATLVPDYSDVRSDDLFYNLSPFEVRYTDYRPFFTEGIDLFNKGGLFYSRRVGSSNLDISKLNVPGTIIKELPSNNRIVNATKVSGRTTSGLGIGVFNAVERASYGVVLDTITDQESKILVNPLTNYSVIVLDQTLPHNSSFALINTNVMREGSAYDANVTGTNFTLNNKPNTYRLTGTIAYSQKYRNGFKLADKDWGHTAILEFSKTAGVFRYFGLYLEESDTYDPNDLGFLYSNNERQVIGGVSINNETPHGNNIKSTHHLNIVYDQLYKQGSFTHLSLDYASFFLKKSWFAYYLNVFSEPIGSHDYYEPRVLDFKTFYAVPASIGVGSFISTNYSKPLALDLNADINFFDQKDRFTINAGMQPRILLSDHFSIFPSFEFSYRNNDEGRITTDPEDVGIEGVGASDILFGRRNVYIFSPNILAKYIIDEKLSFTLRFYQNWNYLTYHYFGKLDENGKLQPTSYKGEKEDGTSLHNSAVSFLSMDINLTWRFQPGSSLSLFYTQGKSLFDTQRRSLGGYFDNFNKLIDQNSNQTLGIKVLYYLDYSTVSKAFKK